MRLNAEYAKSKCPIANVQSARKLPYFLRSRTKFIEQLL